MPDSREYFDAVTAYHAGEYERSFAVILPFAEAGNAEAQCIIGSMFDLGLGRTSDVAQAMQWYLRSAEQGYPVAANNLATLYKSGRYGGLPDESQARDWYKRARELGFDPASRV